MTHTLSKFVFIAPALSFLGVAKHEFELVNQGGV